MPGSSIKGKYTIHTWLNSINKVKYVLDVGAGWGTYVKLYKKNNQIWDAVEIHEPYVKTFFLKSLYHHVYVKDIRTFIPRRMYDVILCGDVIEHISKREGIKVLNQLLKYGRYLIISLPLDKETSAPADNNADYWKNPFERHRSRWSNSIFIKALLHMKAEIIALEKYGEIAVYLVSAKKRGMIEYFPGLLERLIYLKIKDTAKENETSIAQRLKKKLIRLIKKYV